MFSTFNVTICFSIFGSAFCCFFSVANIEPIFLQTFIYIYKYRYKQKQVQNQSKQNCRQFDSEIFSQMEKSKSTPNNNSLKLTLNSQPGPGTYNLPSSIKVTHTQSKQGNTARFKNYQTLAPGPGQYNNDNQSKHMPSTLIMSRYKQQKQDEKPGPGAYQPDYKKVMKSQSGYHIGKANWSSLVNQKKAFIPGPGSYETNKSTVLDMHRAIGFGPERKIHMADLKNVPGPGQYETLNFKSTIHKQPNPIFGKSNRSNSTTLLVPGPGSYQTPSEFVNKTKKGFSIAYRQQLSDKKSFVPGPGSYKMDEIDKLKFKSSSFSMPKSPRLKNPNEKQFMSIPGPEKYTINKSAIQHKSFTLGKQHRKQMANKNQVPGPGSYNSAILNQAPKYSVSKSNISWLKADKNPGPGNYEIKPIPASNVVGMNKDSRKPFYDEKKSVPGPGDYNIPSVLKTNGGFKVGNQNGRKLDNSRVNEPGPGQYQILSTLKGSRTKNI